MDYPYSIKDISSKVKKSEQSLYSLIKKNQEFIKQNSRKQGRFIKYNQAALDWFSAYYGIAQEDPEQGSIQDPREEAQEGRQEAAEDGAGDLSLHLLQAKIEALEAENADLRERLAASEEERKDLRSQIGMALFSLQQEKQEKMRLLPQPRQPIAARVKTFLSSFQRNDKKE